MKWDKLGWLLFFLLLCYFPLFLHLDSLSLRLWDEARRAVSAFEMATDGGWLIPKVEGHPDMYGTKPPLLVWLQAIFMKIVGYNELAVRLPSALAGLATAGLMVAFSWRHLQMKWAGFFGALVLLTTDSYINSHGAIAGDYDALLTLWETAYLLSFFLFLEKEERKYLYLTGLFVALAGLTKGVAGMFFLPGLLLFTFIQNKSAFLFKTRELYLVTLAVALVILGYYFLREAYNPGYLRAVWENELGGRYFGGLEGHTHDFRYYFRVIFETGKYSPWCFFWPLAFLVAIYYPATRRFSLLILINTLVFVAILSQSETKIEWYLLPIIPGTALVVGISLEHLFQGLQKQLPPLVPWSKPALLITFLFALFFVPYQRIIKKVYVFEHSGWGKEQTVYRDFMEVVQDVKDYSILHPHYNGQIVFYKEVYNHKGYNITEQVLHQPPEEVQKIEAGPPTYEAGELVMVCEREAKDALEKRYRREVLRSWEDCRLVEITGLR